MFYEISELIFGIAISLSYTVIIKKTLVTSVLNEIPVSQLTIEFQLNYYQN